MKNTKYKSKSIKTILSEHQEELYAQLQSKQQFPALQKMILELLSSDELKTNPEVPNAIEIFKKAAKNYNYYMSTLTAYMTGISMSK